MRNYFCAILVLLTGFLGCFPDAVLFGQTKIIEAIIARVNDEIITLSDYNSEVNRLRLELSRSFQGEELEKEVTKAKPNILDSIIQSKLLVQKAKDLGFGTKIDQDVNSAIENIRKQNGIPDMRAFEKAVAQQGMTMTRFREEIKNSILQESLIGTFVQSKVVTTDEELKKYYDAHVSEYTKPAEVELAEIVVFLEGKKEADAKAKIDSAVAALKGGEDFSALAKKISEGSTAPQGGNIGTFKEGTMAADVQTMLNNTKVGQYTDVIKSKFGYQILKVMKRKDRELVPMEEVKLNIQKQVYFEKYRPLLDKYLKEVRDESFIEIYQDKLETKS